MSERRTDYPHVTDILKDAGLVDTQWMSQYARDRGTAVHIATALIHEDDLDEVDLDPAIGQFLPSYRRFLELVQPTDVSCEFPVLNKELGYCGTADRLWRIRGRMAITDLKCGARSEWHQLQTAAYANCFKIPLARYALYLHNNGTFNLVEHRNRYDWAVFKAALLIANWHKMQGVTA